MAVLDRTLLLVGTYNLDPLSMTTNSEVIAAIWSPEAASSVGGDAGSIAPDALVEYRILLDQKGRIRLDDDGEPIVAFGTHSHRHADDWSSARRLIPIVRLVRAFRSSSAVF
jgi:phosphatidylserine/phosphatidylglycerophosphate/cardiolipin synthase-like enzyme